MARSNKANQGGSSNRQGPKVTGGAKRGPIIGKMSSVTGTTRPFSLNKGTNKNLLKGNKRGHSS